MELGFLYHLYVNYVKSYVGRSGRSENVETSSTNMVTSGGGPGNPWANLPQSYLESTEHGRVVPQTFTDRGLSGIEISPRSHA